VLAHAELAAHPYLPALKRMASNFESFFPFSVSAFIMGPAGFTARALPARPVASASGALPGT
jgi:hypothetical protein